MDLVDSINRSKRGDTEAFKIVLKAYSRWLLGLVSTLTSKSEAEDLCQEVWIIAWKNLNTLKDENRFKAWIRTIAVREAIRHRSKIKRIDISLSSSPDEISDESEIRSEKIEAKLSKRETINEFLKLLTADQKNTFILFELEGMKISEISEVLKIPEGTVKSRLNKVRDIFSKAAAKEEYVEAKSGR